VQAFGLKRGEEMTTFVSITSRSGSIYRFDLWVRLGLDNLLDLTGGPGCWSACVRILRR